MNNPVFVVFGFGGVLGTAFHRKLSESVPDHRIFAFGHSQVDIGNKEQVREILDYVEPDVVINAAGLSSLDLCEQAHAGAYQANAVGAQVVAQECRRKNAKLVHISSWAVLGGNHCRPCTERAMSRPVNVCGKSKLDGEKTVRATLPDSLIIRIGWLFDVGGDTFLKHWLSRADRHLNIDVPPVCHGSPAFAPDVVDAIVELIDKNAKGTFNVANSDAATWENLAQAVVDLTKCRSKVAPMSPRMRAMCPPMPKYTVMSMKKLDAALGYRPRSWINALKQCLFQMKRYKP